jgi:hypothetical protein
MTDSPRSSYERDWSPFTKKAARSAVLSAMGHTLNGIEVPRELPHEMIVLLRRLSAAHEE